MTMASSRVTEVARRAVHGLGVVLAVVNQAGPTISLHLIIVMLATLNAHFALR